MATKPADLKKEVLNTLSGDNKSVKVTLVAEKLIEQKIDFSEEELLTSITELIKNDSIIIDNRDISLGKVGSGVLFLAIHSIKKI